MLGARKRALARGVNFYWFQVIETMHINWINEIINLKDEFPDNFKIYINPGLHNVPNVCAIDPDLKVNISESMEHRTGMFGQGTEAVSATFVHNNKKAKRTKQIVKELKGLLLDERIKKIEDWHANHIASSSPDITESGVFDVLRVLRFATVGSEGAEALVCPQNRAYGSVHGSSHKTCALLSPINPLS